MSRGLPAGQGWAKSSWDEREDLPVTTPEDIAPRRFGFLEGQIDVPEDFDRMDAEEILRPFYDGPIFPDEAPISRNSRGTT